MNEYLVFCLRRQHNDAYKQWEVVTVVKYEEGVNMPEYLGFHVTEEQANQVINGLKSNFLYVNSETLSDTYLNGWVYDELNGEIVDLRSIPNAYDFIIEKSRPAEVT